jgi:hypothetical protein
MAFTKELEIDEPLSRGIRNDPDTYTYVMRALKRSQKYIEERGIFKKAERYSLMYENEPQKAIGEWRRNANPIYLIETIWIH